MKLLELTLLIRESQLSYDRLGVLDSRIKNGRLSIYNGWGGANGRFKIISRPKFVGIYKKKVEHSFKIKIKPNSPVIKHFLEIVVKGSQAKIKKLYSLEKEVKAFGSTGMLAINPETKLIETINFKDKKKAEQKREDFSQLYGEVSQASHEYSLEKDSIEYVYNDEGYFYSYLGKRKFDCDNVHFWFQLKAALIANNLLNKNKINEK